MPFVGKTNDERRACNQYDCAALGRQPSLVYYWLVVRFFRCLANGLCNCILRHVLGTAPGSLCTISATCRLRLPLQNLKIPKWRTSWDWGLCIGGAVPALVFGVAFGNMFLRCAVLLSDETVRSTYTGSFFALLNPFALVCGISQPYLCLAAHGGAWLMLRTDGDLRARSAKATQIMGIVLFSDFLAAGAWLYFGSIQGYTLAQPFDTNGVANPLAKEVITNANPGWMNNYRTYPITMIAPIMVYFGALDCYASGR